MKNVRMKRLAAFAARIAALVAASSVFVSGVFCAAKQQPPHQSHQSHQLHQPTPPAVRIAAASDLQFALPELLRAFEKHQIQHHGQRQIQHPTNSSMTAVYGSSGNFVAQIKAGAPFDMFLSADVSYAHDLYTSGYALHAPTKYAVGRLVLWTLLPDVNVSEGLQVLAKPRVQRIAIANPAHAPYGKRAREALEKSGLWANVEQKIVLAENVAQAAQYAQTGAVQAALVSLSLVKAPAIAAKPASQGRYVLVDSALHAPLEQSFVILKSPKNSSGNAASVCEAFATFLLYSPEAALILTRHGFALPPQAASKR